MADLTGARKKLITALNKVYDMKLLYTTREFMGKEGYPHTMYGLSQAVWDEEKGKYSSMKIYETASLIRLILYLRDLLFLAQGKSLPMDNEMWNEKRPKELLALEKE